MGDPPPGGSAGQLGWDETIKVQTEAPAKGPETGKPIRIADLDMTLAPIPAGSFRMGSPANEKDRTDDETLHTVRISKPYWMATTEVTQGQYQRIMGTNPSHFQGDDKPVETVSWHDAVSFCENLTERERRAGHLPSGYEYRLPTEAEWEYACRAGSETRFYFGDDEDRLGEYAWYPENSNSQTHNVATKKANAWGLYDMHGNVWEWCMDCYDKDAYNHGDSVADPVGPSTGFTRVARGSSSRYSAKFCRSASRFCFILSKPNDFLGFRVALAPAVQR